MMATGRMVNRWKSTRGLFAAKELLIKIEYKLYLTGTQQMVYDAVIDDVSVVGNYRSQFARILQTIN